MRRVPGSDSLPRVFLPWSWEQNGRTYSRLGVRRLRGFACGGRIWQKLGLAAPTWRGRASAAKYIRQSVPLESAHAASFLFMLALSGWLAFSEPWPAAVIFAANIVVNALPIAVIRYNRFVLLGLLHA